MPCYRCFRYYDHWCSLEKKAEGGPWWVCLDGSMTLITPSDREADEKYEELVRELHKLKEKERPEEDDFIVIP